MDIQHATYRTVIKSNYAALKAIYLTSRPMKDGRLEYGKTTVRVKGVEGFSARGTVSRNCLLGGMSKLYSTFDLQKGDEIMFEVGRDQEQMIMIELPQSRLPIASQNQLAASQVSQDLTPTLAPSTPFGPVEANVLANQGVLEPATLQGIPPQDAEDVLIAFAANNYDTPFHFGRRMTPALAEELHYKNQGQMPHALCIDQRTGRYLVTTVLMRSSEFKGRYHLNDSDLLVCWTHDEEDVAQIPKTVVALDSLAKSFKSII